jgi:hypothetical protein
LIHSKVVKKCSVALEKKRKLEFFAIFVSLQNKQILMGLVSAKEVAKAINADKYGVL